MPFVRIHVPKGYVLDMYTIRQDVTYIKKRFRHRAAKRLPMYTSDEEKKLHIELDKELPTPIELDIPHRPDYDGSRSILRSCRAHAALKERLDRQLDRYQAQRNKKLYLKRLGFS